LPAQQGVALCTPLGNYQVGRLKAGTKAAAWASTRKNACGAKWFMLMIRVQRLSGYFDDIRFAIGPARTGQTAAAVMVMGPVVLQLDTVTGVTKT
jgi:hypothetical protein